MPVTYNLIASNTLSSAAASVTFSAIPGTYTDLVLRLSLRSTSTNVGIEVIFNTGTSGLYSYTSLFNSQGTPTSLSSTNTNNVRAIGTASSASTSNTFGSIEIYIPNYTASSNKPVSAFGTTENNNATTAYFMEATANLFRSTSAISQIVVQNTNSDTFVSGSSFFLYGIKNS